MAFWRRKASESEAPKASKADGSPSIVICSLGGREDLLPDFAYPLGAETAVIGREETCDIQVVDGQISRRHMEVRFDAERDRHVAVDLRSANGTFVNNVRLIEPLALNEGDIIQIGDSRLLYTRKKFKDHSNALQYYRQTGERRKGTLMR